MSFPDPPSAGPPDRAVPILMYHAVFPPEDPFDRSDPGEYLYVVEPDAFRSHLRWVRGAGYETILLRHYLDWLDGVREIPRRSVLITFDDGHVTNRTRALPILLETGSVAEFFVTTGWTGEPESMTAEDIRALRKAGMGIGSHGVSHAMLDDLDDAAVETELSVSKRFLEEILQEEVFAFSAPGGRMTPSAMEIAKKAGYRTVLLSKMGVNRFADGPYGLRRIAIRRNTRMGESLLAKGSPGAWSTLSQRVLDLGKATLGNERYNRIRQRLLR